MFYVSYETEGESLVGGYTTEALAKQFNRDRAVWEDEIYTDEIGFPGPARPVVAYARRHKGVWADYEITTTDKVNNYFLYARTKQGDWIHVRSCNTAGISKVKNKYKECILLLNIESFEEENGRDPREIIELAGTGHIVESKLQFIEDIYDH